MDKVTVSYDQVEAEEFEIPSTLRLVIKNGEKVGQWAGLRPKEEIMAKVMPLL